MAEGSVSTPFSPVDCSRLQSSRLRLVPVQSEHFDRYTALHFKAAQKDNFELYRWQLGTPDTLENLRALFRSDAFQPPKVCLFAIILAAATIKNADVQFVVTEGTFAGWAAIEYQQEISVSEIGLTVHSEFHRTFVATEAIGLLLCHLLNPQPRDLELRKVMWKCNSMNKASRRAAERMGFQLEGISRYARVMPTPWNHEPSVTSDKCSDDLLPRRTPQQVALNSPAHTAYYSICWDDWRSGGRELVQNMMKKYDA